MKKTVLMIFFFSIFPQICFGQTIFDIIYHKVSVTPAFEFMSEAVAVGKMGVQQATNVQSVITQAKTEATNIQSSVMTTFNSIVNGSILSELNGNAGDVEAKFFGKKLGKVKVKKIVKKFKKTFMTYDSEKAEDRQFVDENREKFFQQNIIALNAAASVLLAKLENEVKPKIEESKECAKGDGTKCGIPSTDSGGKNEVWFAYASTLEQYDRLIKMMETVAAVRARLVAITAMRTIKPAYASKKEKEEDEKNNGEDVPDDDKEQKKDQTAFIVPLKAKSFSHTQWRTAFAQVMYKSPTMTLSKVETQLNSVDTPAEKMLIKAVDFVAPEETAEEHPLIANEKKLEALNEVNDVKETVDNAIETHNTLNDLKTYRETAEQIKQERENYQKTLEKLRSSEKCALNYLKAYFKNPVQTWSGINLLKNVERHDLRKGISGWAVEAFETAKAAEASVVTTNDIEEYSMDDSDAMENADDPDLSKAEKKRATISTSIGQGTLEASQKEMRKSTLVSWQIGAEASKILGGNAAKWGTPTGKSMIWTDTKRFYNQYLERKYANIKSYLQSYTKEDILALVISKLKNENETIGSTKYQKKRKETIAEANAKHEDEIKQMKLSMQEYEGSVSAELEGLMKQRKALVSKIDEVSAAIKKASSDLADLRQVAEDKAAEQTEDLLLPKTKFPDPEEDERKQVLSFKLPKLASHEETEKMTLENNKTTLDQKKKEALQKSIDDGKEVREKYNKQLVALDEKIDTAKLMAQGKRGSFNKNASIVEAVKQNIQKKNIENSRNYAIDIDANLRAVLPVTVDKNLLISAAEESLKDINNQADIVIKGAYQQMKALGDELYKPTTHEKLVQIHQKMIGQLKAISLVYVATGVIKFEEAAIFADLLSADTSPETEGFFVGAISKERDLKAPYKIPNFDLPPVREVFHFDATDFKSIKPQNEKLSNRNLTASEFLNCGRDIPKIWQYMLKEDSFIESQYNLKNALSGGCENVSFARGGIMPCVIEGSNIVMDVNSEGKYIRRTDLKVASLPKCFLVDIKKGSPHHMLMDVEVSFYTPLPAFLGGKNEKPTPRNCEYSELGMLLDADENNNLSFKPLAYNSYELLLKNSGNNLKDINDDQKNRMAAANHAMLSRNQIGDFLHHVENESSSRKNIEELEEQYKEQKEELRKKLEKFGFSPTKDFDLANKKDYEKAVSLVKSVKNQLMVKAQNALNSINVSENKPAQEQKAMMQKLLMLMQKDTEGNLNISDISADISNPEEELKKANADSAVVDKLKNSLKEQEKEYTDIDQVFCANYGE